MGTVNRDRLYQPFSNNQHGFRRQSSSLDGDLNSFRGKYTNTRMTSCAQPSPVSYESGANSPADQLRPPVDAPTLSVQSSATLTNGIKAISVCALMLLGCLVLFAYTFPGKLKLDTVHAKDFVRKPAVPQFWHRFGPSHLEGVIPGRMKRDEPKKIPEHLDYGPLDEPNCMEYTKVLSALRTQIGSLYAVDVPGEETNFSYAHLSRRPWTEQLKANFLWAVNLHVPNKAQRTAYFEQLMSRQNPVAQLPRFAHAIIFHPPEIREYLVGPMKAPTEIQLLRTLPYQKRPLGTIEYEALVDFLAIQCTQLDSLLQEVYGASYFREVPSAQWRLGSNEGYSTWLSGNGTSRCQTKFDKPNAFGRPHCLMPTFTSPMTTHEAPDRRRMWLRLMHQVIAFIQHPVDIQFYVDHTSVDPNEWFLVQIWFQGHFYKSVGHLMKAWKDRQFRVRYRPFANLYGGDIFGKTGDTLEEINPTSKSSGSKKSSFLGSQWMKNLLGRTKRDTTQTPGQTSEKPSVDNANRLRIKNRHVKYDLWDFHFTVRRDTGLRFYGVYFDGISILAEGGMDETATVYWGWTPFMRHLTSLETMFGVGAMASELAPGLDCPESATYFPVQLVLAGDVGPVEIEHGVCLFESTVDPPGAPVRRHYEFALNPSVEYGLPTVTENDHTNFGFGAPGHIHVDAFYPWPEPNRFQPVGLVQSSNAFGFLSNTDLLNFVIHHHLFHFKLDVDVIDQRNAFDVVYVYGPLSLNDSQTNLQGPGKTDPSLPPGLWMTKKRVKTEMEARFHTKFEVPAQYLTCAKADQFSRSGPPNLNCVALVNKGAIKTLLSDTHTEAFAWTRHQLSVTRYHDDEPRASSIYNGVDLVDPVVNFTKFSENDESIENADLVLWVTVGNYHLPRHEDLPNTVTSGGKLAFYLTPHNLFRYSPDALQCDRFFTKNKADWIRGSGVDPDCVSQSVPRL
nr:unnamed protein product [Fasciola hepatica]